MTTVMGEFAWHNLCITTMRGSDMTTRVTNNRSRQLGDRIRRAHTRCARRRALLNIVEATSEQLARHKTDLRRWMTELAANASPGADKTRVEAVTVIARACSETRLRIAQAEARRAEVARELAALAAAPAELDALYAAKDRVLYDRGVARPSLTNVASELKALRALENQLTRARAFGVTCRLLFRKAAEAADVARDLGAFADNGLHTPEAQRCAQTAAALREAKVWMVKAAGTLNRFRTEADKLETLRRHGPHLDSAAWFSRFVISSDIFYWGQQYPKLDALLAQVVATINTKLKAAEELRDTLQTRQRRLQGRTNHCAA